MAAPTLLHHDHQVLGSDFCSGYVDAFGKWNTGFFCPLSPREEPLFCCGIPTFKYCCTGKERSVSPSATTVEDPLLLVLAITLGVAAGITLLTLFACFICPGCLLHRKRRPGSSLHRLPYSSTASNYSQTTRTAVNPGPSMYSLTDPLCSRTTSINEIINHAPYHLQSHPRQIDDLWRISSNVQEQNASDSEATEPYDRIITPPPPYDSNMVPLRPVVTSAGSNRPLNEALTRHTSPRQPTLCIVSNPHNAVNSAAAYHSIKF